MSNHNNNGSSWNFSKTIAVLGIAGAVVVVVAIIGVFYAGNKLVDKPEQIVGKVADFIKEGLRPNVKITNIIMSSIESVKKEAKLVVMSAEVAVSDSRSSAKTTLFGYLNLGTTVVDMKVPGNKVQYVVPTDSISYHWDETKGEAVIEVAMPYLDETIVEVQSDPKLIEVRTDVGWARLKSYSGDYLTNEIKSTLRDKVIKEGKKEFLLQQAHRNAEEVILKIFKDKLKAENVECPIRVNIN